MCLVGERKFSQWCMLILLFYSDLSLGVLCGRVQLHYQVRILHLFSTIFLSFYLVYSLILFLSSSFSILPQCYLPLVISPPLKLSGSITHFAFVLISQAQCLPIFVGSHFLSFGLQQQMNSLIFFFFFLGGSTVKTWFLSTVNGGRPLMLFGLV